MLQYRLEIGEKGRSQNEQKETSKTEERLPDEVFREDSRKEEEERQGVAKRASLAVFILVVLLFAAVMFITYFFEFKFGKTAGTIALIAVALLIAGYLYKNELMEKIKRKK